MNDLRVIKIKTSQRKRLMEDFYKSSSVVSLALNFRQNTLESRRLRCAAVNHYGGNYIQYTL